MKKLVKWFVVLLFLLMVIVFFINIYVVFSTKDQILKIEDSNELENIDCIVVLGAAIWGDSPSPMLRDRLLKAVNLYENGVAPKIIVSGDHHKQDYDEVNVMKDYLIEQDILSENIFMDHSGFSTYESIYRAKEIFEAKRIVVVTQEYHLYRALYIAECLGLKAYGASADNKKYSGALYRELREVLARNKDFVQCIFKPKATYMGEVIPINGNGDVTNDK